jgi:chemotaxis signal transduction protein
MFISHPKSRDRQAQKRLPFMVVRFPTLNLAFDMAQLHQVRSMPVVQYSPTLMLGVAQVTWGDDRPSVVACGPKGLDDRANPPQRDVIVIDLHCKLYDISLEAPEHLLLFQSKDGLLYGIPVAKLPEITSIPEDLLLPQSQDTMDLPTLGLTRQLVKLPTPMGEQTLFVVDVQQLVQTVRQMAAG